MSDQDVINEQVQYRIERNVAFADALHEFATWLAQNAEVVEMPWRMYVDTYVYSDDTTATPKERLAAIARSMGRADKYSEFGTFGLRRYFGENELLRYSVGTNQEDTCERKVVGTKTVTRRKLPEDFEYEQVEEEVEIVEWDCPSLLAP